jgi:hypothetical protein
MSKPETPKQTQADKKAARAEKLAAALRANLKRRKAGRQSTKTGAAKSNAEENDNG